MIHLTKPPPVIGVTKNSAGTGRKKKLPNSQVKHEKKQMTFHESSWLVFSGSMVYLPTFTIKKQPNVGKYAVHGWYCWWFRNPVPVEVGSLPHHFQDSIHPRWLFGSSEPSTVGILISWLIFTPICARVNQLLISGMVIPPVTGNLYIWGLSKMPLTFW